jgi:hypothetical protein
MGLDFSSARAERNDRVATVLAALVFYAVAYTLAWLDPHGAGFARASNSASARWNSSTLASGTSAPHS